MRRWWNAELTAQRRAYNAAHRSVAKDDPADPSWGTMRAARNRYHSTIRRAKRAHWHEYICDLPRGNIWQAAKYAVNPASKASSSRIPDLVAPDGSIAASPEAKAKVFHQKFFPPKADIPPPDADEAMPEPHPAPTFTVQDVHRAIAKLSPWKAPGPSGIPNVAIKAANTVFAPILFTILEASLRIGYFPKSWRVFLTVTIRKPGKSDYTQPGAHRPIAEEECLGKVIESVVTEWLSGFAERHGLLSPNQFGGRPGRCTVDALLQLVQRIKDAWRVGKVASLLLMDISQAFPSVSHEHLIRTLECKRIPTTVSLTTTSPEPCAVPNGLPQGSPLSALLYLIFADDLLDGDTLGYIDDNSRLEVGFSLEETTSYLRNYMVQHGLPRSKRLGLRFDLPKFQLIHFVSPHRHTEHYRPLPLHIGDICIEASTTAKLLGVLLDYKLSFRNHVELAHGRGTKAVLALSRIATPTFGLPHSYVRQLFLTIVVPRMEYALPVWYRPVTERAGARRTGTVWVSKALGKVQRQACKLITGALRTTATDVLDFHANLLPIHICLNRSVFNAATRLATLPVSNPRDFETIDPQRRFVPIPDGVLTTKIAQTKDDAKDAMARITSRGGMCIFTDGSGFEGGVGSAAVAMRGEEVRAMRKKHLGDEDEHTVFEAEVCGAILALDIIAGTPRLTDVDLFMDCQPTIHAISSPRSQPGQYLLAAFHALLGRLSDKHRTLRIRIHWVPAHVGIAGNELVDAHAKDAALGDLTPLASRITLFESPLPSSKSAVVASGIKAFAARWLREWQSSPRFARIAAFDSAIPSKAVVRMYSNLSCPGCSVLTQLRTGHIGLNAYLHRFHLAPSPLCPHCASAPESVPHFLLACPTLRAHRLRLIARIGTARISMRRLLSIKHDPAPVLAFVEDLRRYIIAWIKDYERFYYQYDEARLSTCTLTIHGLIHVPDDLLFCGPGWTTWTFWMERYCGFLKDALRSKKSPWANLNNITLHRTYLEQLDARYELAEELSSPQQRVNGLSTIERKYEGYSQAILRAPCKKNYSPAVAIRHKIAVYFSAVLGKPVKDIESQLPENMPCWGKVRIVDGDSICCTWAAKNHSEKGRNMSFIRYECEVKDKSHRGAWLPTIFYGQLDEILVCKLPPNRKLWGQLAGKLRLLAIITPYRTGGQDAALKIVSHQHAAATVALDLQSVMAVVGRVHSQRKWFLIDRTGGMVRPEFVPSGVEEENVEMDIDSD
ncbi:hypothetical protein MVEN_00123200 [Mycena venus]|uniref:Reverse transcriptase n=1 Tax=Mycena venus TaxID=2733690 RepID=A0A8H6Z4V1_9AGAR|nr:hypothetical protein MVEN_00123200 [Mycena venus]